MGWRCRSSSAPPSHFVLPRVNAEVPQLRLSVVAALSYGRDSGIRTHDLLVPNEARYQAALYPVTRNYYSDGNAI